MATLAFRTILAALDEEGAPDAVARSAATLAEWTSAALRHLPPGRPISQAVRDVGADLVVLAPHRGGALGAHLLGTRTDDVVREAGVPCLVVREPLAPPLRRVGVASDLSPAADAALDAAIAWRRLAGGEREGHGDAPAIRLAHVGWPVEAEDDPDLEADVLRPRLERQAAAARARARDAAPSIGVEVIWANEPAEALCTWAAKNEIDLLVVGTHGAPRLKRLLVGSITAAIARRCPCPLLVLPASDAAPVETAS